MQYPKLSTIQKLCGNKYYSVLTTPGDPFVRPARARLIWAANTAQAVHNLGLKTQLAADASKVPIKFETPGGVASVKRMIKDTYNVNVGFDVLGLFGPPSRLSKSYDNSKWAHSYEIPRFLFPHTGILHTRDPLVLKRALETGLIGIYEDHDEDHNNDFKELPALATKHANLRVIVAITEAVKSRLLNSGVPEHKVIVLPSGVNGNSFVQQNDAALAIRQSLHNDGFRKIVVYSGGLQIERGIEHIITAAQLLSDVMFVLLGGNHTDQGMWATKARQSGMANIRVPGYLQQKQLLAFQQAADVLLATRQHDLRATITSPLKFFEYLAAGQPIVSANMAALYPYETQGLALTTYDSASPATLASVLTDTFERFPWQPNGYQQNIDLAHQYTWENRQMALFDQLIA